MQQEIPRLLKDFLVYLTTIKGKSPRTRKEYEYDISLFLRFIKSMDEDIPANKIEEVNIKDIKIDRIREVTLEDLYMFIEFCEVQRNNSAATRARKVATLKSFSNI